jgi:hypothetical protein
MVISSLSKLYLGVAVFVFIICLATFLRVYELNINPPALFGDEVDLRYKGKVRPLTSFPVVNNEYA